MGAIDAYRGMYNRLVIAARDRKLPVQLSLEDLVAARSAGECHYCGGPLPPKSYGLDRIDNAKGYAPGNVIAACTMCNRARGAYWSYDEFVQIIAIRVAVTGRGNAWPQHAAERTRIAALANRVRDPRGRKYGQTSPAIAAAAREAGKLGGRPRK